MLLTFKCMQGCAPLYLRELLVKQANTRTLRSEFSLLQKGCHGNGVISSFVQLFCFGIMQFLYNEIISFHFMYDAAWSTAG